MRWYIANEARITISYETSAIEIIVLFKKPMKYREFFPTLFVKITNFSLFLNLSRRVHLPYFICRAWQNGSHTMMAKPIRALELHYPMVQFLIKKFIPCHREYSQSESQKPVFHEQIPVIVVTSTFSRRKQNRQQNCSLSQNFQKQNTRVLNTIRSFKSKVKEQYNTKPNRLRRTKELRNSN